MQTTTLKLSAGLVALLLAGGAAGAADLGPITYNKAAPPIAAPITDWTGFYSGIHGGYGWGNAALDDTTLFANPTPQGYVFGGQAGYNWQYGAAIVVGLEADYSVANLTDSQTITAVGVIGRLPVGASATLATKIDDLATVRSRAGFLVLPNVLLYGTGGIAWAHSSATDTLTVRAGNATATTTSTGYADNFGWVAGVGAEVKVWDHILVRGEFLHYDFADLTYTVPAFGSANAKVTADIARAAVSYKF